MVKLHFPCKVARAPPRRRPDSLTKKKKQLSVTQDKFTSNIFTPKFAEKRPKANGMEISSIVYRKSKKFRCNKIS